MASHGSGREVAAGAASWRRGGGAGVAYWFEAPTYRSANEEKPIHGGGAAGDGER